MRRFWRTFFIRRKWKKFIQGIDHEVYTAVITRGLMIPTILLPIGIVGSYFLPITRKVDKIKSRNGYDETMYNVDMESQRLVQEVIEDLKASHIPPNVRRMFQLFDVELYPCKGHEFILHFVSQVSFSPLSVGRLLVIGVPEFVSSRNSTYMPSVPKIVDSSQSGEFPARSHQLLQAPSAGLPTVGMATESAGKISTSSTTSPLNDGNPRQPRIGSQNILDFNSNLSWDEKKFLIFRHFLSWSIRYRRAELFQYLLLLFFLMVCTLLRLRQLFYLIPFNCTCVYVLLSNYQVWTEKDIMCRFECNMVMNCFSERNIIRNSVKYISAGSSYCMKKLKFNYQCYEEQEKSRHSMSERILNIIRLVLSSFLPISQNIYGRGGQIKSLPSDYFNYDFYWAFNLKKVLDKLPSESVVWREWLSNCGRPSAENSGSGDQSRIFLTDEFTFSKRLLIFKSVVIPFRRENLWDMISTPKQGNHIARQADRFLRLYGLNKSSDTCNVIPS